MSTLSVPEATLRVSQALSYSQALHNNAKKADNVTSLCEKREASEAKELAQGHLLGPLLGLSDSSVFWREGRRGRMRLGLSPASSILPGSRSQAKYAANGFAVAVRGLKLLS